MSEINEGAYYAGRAKGYEDGTVKGDECAKALASISIAFSLVELAAVLKRIEDMLHSERGNDAD